MVFHGGKQLQAGFGSFFRRGARIAGLWRARWLPGCLSGRCDRWISWLLKSLGGAPCTSSAALREAKAAESASGTLHRP